MNERVILSGRQCSLVGIVTEPTEAVNGESPPGVIILNAGIVHRVGPSRISVKLARRLADMGFHVTRFDHSGKGDSDVRRDQAPFLESSIEEARDIMDDLTRQTGIERFILVGLCSGAVTAFKAACMDRRIVGIVQINGQVYEDNPQWNLHVYNKGWARWYWKHSLFSPKSWWRALTGKIHYRRLLGVLLLQTKNKVKPPEAVTQVAGKLTAAIRGLIERDVRLLMIYSEGDRGLDYFRMIMDSDRESILSNGAVRCEVIKGSDHTFTLLRSQQPLFDIVAKWAAGYLETAKTPEPPGEGG